jgi:TetR/AcrR family transcriptional regulator
MVNMQKATESHILKTARTHFVRNGFAGTRMQEIANEAEINKALLHYYFRSKAKLYEKVIDASLNALIPPLANAMDQPGPFAERLERIVDIYISTLLEHPDIPVFILSELSQRQESFIEHLKKRSEFFPAVQSFMLQMSIEMEEGTLHKMPPLHLFLNIIGLIVFPFIAKPIFQTIFNIEQHDFENLMRERKDSVMEFIQKALIPDSEKITPHVS